MVSSDRLNPPGNRSAQTEREVRPAHPVGVVETISRLLDKDVCLGSRVNGPEVKTDLEGVLFDRMLVGAVPSGDASAHFSTSRPSCNS